MVHQSIARISVTDRGGSLDCSWHVGGENALTCRRNPLMEQFRNRKSHCALTFRVVPHVEIRGPSRA